MFYISKVMVKSRWSHGGVMVESRHGVPGGPYEGPKNGGDLPQEDDQSAVMKRWNWKPGETEHPGETNTHLNRRGDEVKYNED